ncbi:MAG: polysaccharide deacetylase family protein [Cyanobacteriota bacterium]|nr:polysaccharide deacetylase family protein [Cyanobacteriota bacterium]
MQSPEYSPISQRPLLTLPNQARVAVWVVMNIEHFTFGQLGTAIQPHLTSPPEIANYGWRDYGNRVGIWRLFDLFANLGMPVTAALNAEICTLYPAIVQELRRQNWEVMAHGWNNSTGHSGLDPESERQLIDRTLTLLTEAAGSRPLGWLTPGFSVSESTFELLHAAGIRYIADWVNDDQPYAHPVGGGSLLAIPYSLETNDISLCLSARLSGSAFAQALIDQFDCLWEEGSLTPRIMAIGLHPFIVGQPLRFKYLQQALRYILHQPETWITTGSAIYNWVINR